MVVLTESNWLSDRKGMQDKMKTLQNPSCPTKATNVLLRHLYRIQGNQFKFLVAIPIPLQQHQEAEVRAIDCVGMQCLDTRHQGSDLVSWILSRVSSNRCLLSFLLGSVYGKFLIILVRLVALSFCFHITRLHLILLREIGECSLQNQFHWVLQNLSWLKFPSLHNPSPSRSPQNVNTLYKTYKYI